jgi:hypothetical protein
MIGRPVGLRLSAPGPQEKRFAAYMEDLVIAAAACCRGNYRTARFAGCRREPAENPG